MVLICLMKLYILCKIIQNVLSTSTHAQNILEYILSKNMLVFHSSHNLFMNGQSLLNSKYRS